MRINRVCFVDFPLRKIIKNYPTQLVNVKTDYDLTTIQRVMAKLPFVGKLIKKERNNWVNDCKGYDTVLLFDLRKNYSYYANKIEHVVDSQTRLIVYLLNPVMFSDDYKNLSDRWEIWSFSETDAKQYGFKYGETFYDPSIPDYYKDEPITKDVFFIGTEKGRKESIKMAEKELKSLGLKTDIRIADNTKALYNRNYSKYLSYDENCKEVASSKILLEIVQNGQTGLTLRSMESLFFQKKLITNNRYIKESPLYTPRNYFVIDDDEWGEIKAFVDSPSGQTNEKMRMEFTFKRWLERLLNNIEFVKSNNE